ncbi:MAG: hypothetical protein P8P36_08940 [Akkermansiaceae bacterium]|nr:hypothetical protein [Akkermansiaceae bacterium]
MQHLITPLALSLSLLTLSCNKDSDPVSTQDRTAPNGSEQSSDLRDAKPAKNRLQHTAGADIEKRRAEHHRDITKAVTRNLKNLENRSQADQTDKNAEANLHKKINKWLNDPVIFGEQRYATSDQVKDHQISYYLPKKSDHIQLIAQPFGHFALYKISEQDFKDHMVMVWERYRKEYVEQGGKRWIKHSNQDVESSLMGREVGSLHYIHISHDQTGKPQIKKSIDDVAKIKQIAVPKAIIGSGWKTLGNVIEYQGPLRANGGSSTYYHDPSAGYTFHVVGYN